MRPPFGGLLFDRFAQLRDEGRLVMFAVHPETAWHLRLIRGICDRYAFMQDGELRLFSTYEDFSADPDAADYLSAVK